MHGNAKEQSEISEEKEIVEIAMIQAMGKEEYGNLTISQLQKALDENAGKGKTISYSVLSRFVIKFNDKNRYYEVDEKGNVSDAIYREKIEYAGDITKGGRCKGTADNPYEISCVEDLVAFSRSSNQNGTNNRNYILTRDIDMASYFSYDNYTTTEYDTYLGGDGTNDLITQLSMNGNGFVPICYANNKSFDGIFNGNGKKIKNLYVNFSNSCVGFFGRVKGDGDGAVIRNLTLDCVINSRDASFTGGIVGLLVSDGYNNGIAKIENCLVYGKINAKLQSAGGIVGLARGYVDFLDCINYAEVTSPKVSGGICGRMESGHNINFKNVGNYGTIIWTGNSTHEGAGGIVGEGNTGNIIVENGFNSGEIKSTATNTNKTFSAIGGIVGNTNSMVSLTIKNTFNIGALTAINANVGGIAGKKSNNSSNTITLVNCYYKNANINNGIGNVSDEEGVVGKNEEYLISEAFVNTLNSNLEEDYAKWIYNKNQYPTLDFKTKWHNT